MSQTRARAWLDLTTSMLRSDIPFIRSRMMRPSFSQLWLNYPTNMQPCDEGWENQCAIRMSIALIATGVDLDSYTQGPMCTHGHARGAQSLGDYLHRKLFWPRKMAGTEFQQAVAGKTGIVCFKDIAGFQEGRGDHIDLWSRGRTKSGSYASSSSETWFWELE